MKPKHRTVWTIFIDDKLNSKEQWKKATMLTNSWFIRYSKKSATRLVDKLYKEHNVWFFATIHSETKRCHGARRYKYVIYPVEQIT